MDKFPRGSLPPSVFVPLAPGKPAEVDYVVMVPTACEADLKQREAVD